MTRTLSGLLVLCLAWPALAADPPAAPPLLAAPWPPATSNAELADASANLESRDPFQTGQVGFQFMGGYFKKSSMGPGGKSVDYSPLAARFSWMLNTPCDDHGFLRGSFEALIEAYYAPIIREFGTYLTGPDLIVRYNFVQQDCLVTPYIQAGAGFVFTDAYKETAQRLIGQEFEFLLRGEVGARLMLLDCLSFDTEVGYQHVSNARMAPRNGGLNNLGVSFGVTYFFGRIK